MTPNDQAALAIAATIVTLAAAALALKVIRDSRWFKNKVLKPTGVEPTEPWPKPPESKTSYSVSVKYPERMTVIEFASGLKFSMDNGQLGALVALLLTAQSGMKLYPDGVNVKWEDAKPTSPPCPTPERHFTKNGFCQNCDPARNQGEAK